MNTTHRSSRKLVEDSNATRYLFIMVISLAVTVTFTRLYLEMTGYPQLGNGTFHIAHALWGALLQAVAVTLTLIYLNQWIAYLSASLAGIGIGLFVDEIGKFITQTNDYFFPLAAPMIYMSIIFGVLLYLFIRREDAHDARSDMYIVLDNLKPLLDQQMNHQQFNKLRHQLTQLAEQSERSDIASLAKGLLQALPPDTSSLPESSATFTQKTLATAKRIEAKFLTQTVIRRILKFFLLMTGIGTASLVIVLLLMLSQQETFELLIVAGILQDSPLITNANSLNWYIALIIINVFVGVILWIAFILLIRHREHEATHVAIIGLVLSLTIGSTLSFYFSQFAVMMSTISLFLILVMFIRYRDRFLSTEDTER